MIGSLITAFFSEDFSIAEILSEIYCVIPLNRFMSPAKIRLAKFLSLSDRERNFAHRIFAGLMNRFKGMTRHISERMAAIFRSPEKKAEIKEPIKESIRDRLARNQKRADELNARRREEQGLPPKRKQQNIEL